MNQPNDKLKPGARSVSLAHRVSPFVNNLFVRLLLAIVVGLTLGRLAADLLSDSLIPATTNALAQQLAAEVRQGNAQAQMLEAFRQNGAVFCYITNEKSPRPTSETEALAGNFKILRTRPGKFSVADKSFYQAVAPVTGEQNLHVGLAYRGGKSLHTLVRNPLLFLMSRGDLLDFVVEFIFVVISIALVSYVSVIRPANLMANLPFGEDKDKNSKFKSATRGASFEILHMYKAFMAYSKSARSVPSRSTDFQRPLEVRIDDALQDRKQSSNSEFTRVLSPTGEQAGGYRALEANLTECTGLKEFRDELVNGLSHMGFKYCVLLQQGGDSAIAATSYVDHRALQLLGKIDHKVILKLITETNKTMDIGAMSLRRYGFGMLSEYMNLKNVRYSPVKHHGALMAALIVFFDAQMSESSVDSVIDLESFCSRIGGIMANLLRKQELEDAGFKDQLTGLPNRKSLQDYLSERLLIAAKDSYKEPVSLLIIQPNISDEVITNHGDAVRDKILQEVAAELQLGLKESLDKKVNSMLVRYDVEEFAVCAQPLSEIAALDLGVRLQARILKSKASVGDLFGVTLTIGSATSPADAKDERALVSRAKLAMRFAEEFKIEAQIASAREVPLAYEPSKRLADISGELGVLDCAALLQSIANSQKTGILTVEDELDRQFQSTFKHGKLLSSALDEFHSMDAVIEFVTSFEAGRYNFRLVSDAELDKIVPKDSAPHLPLDKCLMEAALAEDHLKKAKRHLREHFLMRATPGEDAQQKWIKIQHDTRTYNSIERHTMQRILFLSDGSRTLQHIFTELQFAPTYLKWHAAAILTDNRLLQTKKGH